MKQSGKPNPSATSNRSVAYPCDDADTTGILAECRQQFGKLCQDLVTVWLPGLGPAFRLCSTLLRRRQPVPLWGNIITLNPGRVPAPITETTEPLWAAFRIGQFRIGLLAPSFVQEENWTVFIAYFWENSYPVETSVQNHFRA
jgi:hypothetical protein